MMKLIVLLFLFRFSFAQSQLTNITEKVGSDFKKIQTKTDSDSFGIEFSGSLWNESFRIQNETQSGVIRSQLGMSQVGLHLDLKSSKESPWSRRYRVHLGAGQILGRSSLGSDTFSSQPFLNLGFDFSIQFDSTETSSVALGMQVNYRVVPLSLSTSSDLQAVQTNVFGPGAFLEYQQRVSPGQAFFVRVGAISGWDTEAWTLGWRFLGF